MKQSNNRSEVPIHRIRTFRLLAETYRLQRLLKLATRDIPTATLPSLIIEVTYSQPNVARTQHSGCIMGCRSAPKLNFFNCYLYSLNCCGSLETPKVKESEILESDWGEVCDTSVKKFHSIR